MLALVFRNVRPDGRHAKLPREDKELVLFLFTEQIGKEASRKHLASQDRAPGKGKAALVSTFC